MDILTWLITVSKVIIRLFSTESDLLGVHDLVCLTLYSTYPLVPWRKHLLLTHALSGTMSLELPEYFGVQMVEKSEMMLKRAISHCESLCTCKVRLASETIIFSRCQAKTIKKGKKTSRTNKGVYNSFFGKPHFLSAVGWGKEKWQKRRGSSKTRKSEKRDTLMKQETTTGAGSRWVAGSLILWRVCCQIWGVGLRRQETRTDIALSSSVVMSAILQTEDNSGSLSAR